jgi:hypothetical protein
MFTTVCVATHAQIVVQTRALFALLTQINKIMALTYASLSVSFVIVGGGGWANLIFAFSFHPIQSSITSTSLSFHCVLQTRSKFTRRRRRFATQLIMLLPAFVFRGIPITFVLRVHIQTEFKRGICRAVICLGRVPIVRFLVNVDVKGEEGFVHEQQNSAVLRDG